MDGRRLILAIGAVLFIIVMSIVIFSVDWGGSNDPVQTTSRSVNIADYSDTNTKVRMTVRGPIINDQEHEQLQITVGVDGTSGDLLGGFQGNILRSEQTGNNPESYRAFLSAINNLGFLARQEPRKGLQYDGACPRNLRITFEFLDGGEDTPESTWATTCSKKDGNFAGDLGVIRTLFNAQLPEDQFRALRTDTSF